MIIQQMYTGCLSQGAYYIENNGEVAIIDPLREVQPYLDLANTNNATIKYIFETHFHADFVSGHLDLSKKTNAPIVFGPTKATLGFEAIIAEDKQVFALGDATITLLHTPGHTLESSVYLLKDKAGKDVALFSGDTLFLGDVGRPDLAQKASIGLTQEKLAGMLFHSLRNKIMPLADDVIVYPAHGAGSACGKNLSRETSGTLGEQKQHNYALRASMTEDEFIKELTTGLSQPPAYFPQNVQMNIHGYDSLDTVIERGVKGLDVDAFESLAEGTGAIILDVRHQREFVKGFIPRSIFIGIDGGFAPWVGALLKDVTIPILLIVPKGREEEAITRLSRVGFDNTLGYLEGGLEAWRKAGKSIDTIHSISAKIFETELEPNSYVFDVRKQGEFNNSHLKQAQHTPLSQLTEYLSEFPKQDKGMAFVHCAGGYRSVIAISILKRNGIHNLIDVAGGYKDIKPLSLPTSCSESSCGV